MQWKKPRPHTIYYYYYIFLAPDSNDGKRLLPNLELNHRGGVGNIIGIRMEIRHGKARPHGCKVGFKSNYFPTRFTITYPFTVKILSLEIKKKKVNFKEFYLVN